MGLLSHIHKPTGLWSPAVIDSSNNSSVDQQPIIVALGKENKGEINIVSTQLVVFWT